MFIDPSYAGLGVAKRLIVEIFNYRHIEGRLTAFVSKTALPFFERQGFKVVKENKNQREGVVLINYLMERSII